MELTNVPSGRTPLPIYSIDLSGSSFSDWTLSGQYADFELVGSTGTSGGGYSFGHAVSHDPTIHSGGQPNTLKYSDVSAIATSEPIYDDINGFGHETDWLHKTFEPGLECGDIVGLRIVHNSRYYKPDVGMTDVATVYQSDVIDVAQPTPIPRFSTMVQQRGTMTTTIRAIPPRSRTGYIWRLPTT